MSEDKVPVGKREERLEDCQLCYSCLLFFIKSNFSLTNKRFLGTIPNLFWVIPVGNTEIAYPLPQIASITCSSSIAVGSLFFAVIITLIGFSMITRSIIGLPIMLFGFLQIVDSFRIFIAIRNTGGERIVYRIALWEKSKGQKLARDVNQAIVDRM